MPDISKLPELAEIFGVSVDELIGEKSLLVEAAINDNIKECLVNQNPSAEEVADALPILKPDQVKTIVVNVDKSEWEIIYQCLPFMDEGDVKEFALKAMEQGEKLDGFLPFMDEDDVQELALKSLETGEKIEKFLPFMDESDVKDLAMQALNAGEKIEIFLPFMDEEDVKELAVKALKMTFGK